MQSYIDVKYTPGSKNGVCKTVYQYDTGWKLRITALSEEAAVQIHYSIDGIPKAMMDVPEFETDSWVSNVPNALLAQSRPISVYIYVSPDEHSGQTMMHTTISITPREKPDGYQYSEAEIQGFNYMLSQLEQAKEAVADSVKKTEESARQAEQAVQNANNAANAANEAAELINNMEFVGGEALENDESPRVTKSIIDGILHLTFDIPVGDTGDIGPQGIPGGYYIPTVDADGMITFTPTEENMDIVDPMNIKGPKGEKGDPGKSLVIRSMYASYEDMIEAHPVGVAGDAYFVGTSESNVVYMWDEETSEWINIGSLRGPQGVDGGYYVPAVGDDGFIRWQGTKEGMPEIDAKNITGPQGEPGKDGKDGKSIAILGQYATLEDLKSAHSTGHAGDMYAVGTPNNNVAYMWDETESDWLCVGNLLGNVYVDPTDSNTSWMAAPIDADTLRGFSPDDFVFSEEMPTKLPNPHSLTVNDTVYDGSKEVKIQIDKITWDNLLDKPDEFTPEFHYHQIEEIDNLSTQLGSFIKTINGQAPNSNGNIQLSLTGGSVSSVAGIDPDLTGNVPLTAESLRACEIDLICNNITSVNTANGSTTISLKKNIYDYDLIVGRLGGGSIIPIYTKYLNGDNILRIISVLPSDDYVGVHFVTFTVPSDGKKLVRRTTNQRFTLGSTYGNFGPVSTVNIGPLHGIKLPKA